MSSPTPHDWLESIIRYASPDQYGPVYAPFRQMFETYDKRVRILGELNTHELSQFDTDKVTAFTSVIGRDLRIVLDREAKGEMKWVAGLFPTLAYAQDANMSLSDYEDFVLQRLPAGPG